MRKTKNIALILGVLVMSFAVGYLAIAWTDAPTGIPPDCPSGYSGCDAPIHVGGTGQTKSGALTVQGDFTAPVFYDANDSLFYVNPAGASNLGSLKIGGTEVITSTRVLQNVTADTGIITSGTFGTARIPNLDASIITTGTLANARTTGISTATANTLVLRDAAARFAAATPSAEGDVATKGYVDAASGSACPTNYGNLCLNGGGLQFTYSSQTLYIDAFPRSTYVIGGGGTGAYFESQYGLAWQHCERIGARLATLAEWQAACSALGGPSGNGLTTFGGSISGRSEWTATSTSGGASDAMLAGLGSCSYSTTDGVDTQYTGNWFRCVR